MKQEHILRIANELSVTPKQVHSTAELLQQDATVPFIARYRKEATGGLDEVNITSIRDRLTQLDELDKRRIAILKSLEERELLTDELTEQINAAETMTVLEDIYLPFRPKRRTRATIAKEKGLEPLANILFLQDINDVFAEAKNFINPELGVNSEEEALSGARDIIAENINEDKNARERMRELMVKKAFIYSKVYEEKEELGVKYKDYYKWNELASDSPSHRILAMLRGENEEVLKIEIHPEEQDAIDLLNRLFAKSDNASSAQVKLAIDDGYKRLLKPGMETDFRALLKEKADTDAISVFADNLRQLLLAPPLGQKNILALDPGFRTGCKLVCLDSQGKLLHNETIYPHTSSKMREEAALNIPLLCKKFSIEAIAIGNGTAGRETEAFIKELNLHKDIFTILVNESMGQCHKYSG